MSHSPHRIQSIDALRGIVMLIMLADHVREFFFLHRQVADPMPVETTEPSLFLARIIAHLCPTLFIFLSGLSVYLYGQRHQADRARLSRYLLSRGIFLVLLEVTLVNFAWTFRFPPEMLYLQVIWAIGLSMITLAGLVWLPVPVILIVGLLIVSGHNALTPVSFAPGSFFHVPWAILHDRSVIQITDSLSARTSYPILPWIGVIALGYASGFGYRRIAQQKKESFIYIIAGIILLTLFMFLRFYNLYGETRPWQLYPSPLQTVMSFFNVTKYPASLLFLLLTFGIGFLLYSGLCAMEKRRQSIISWLAVFGKTPLFFYILHLYVLHVLYQSALYVMGANQQDRYGFDSIGENWLLAAVLSVPLYYACKFFLVFKKSRPYKWLAYF